MKYEPTPDPEIKNGYVISQSIEPNEKVEKGTIVTIVVSNGEIASEERETSIELGINSNVTGEFNFRYYIDGALVSELSETRDISLNKTIKWDISGTGTHNYTIMIENPLTGERKTLIRYDVNFDNDPVTKDEIAFNPNVFSELTASAETTAPETEPPLSPFEPVTEADETEPEETLEPIAEL